MDNREYWKRRDIVAREQLLNKSIEQVLAQVKKNYRQLANKIVKEMITLYNQIKQENEDGEVLVSHLYKQDRYYQLLASVQEELDRLGLQEEKLLGNGLETLYINNADLIINQLGISADINTLNAGNAIKQIWCADKKDWSQRIWADKKLLMEKLQQGLIDTCAGGFSPDRFKRQLIDDFNVSYYNADRIVRTESSRVYNQSALDTYGHCGIKRYKILAEIDERTCTECRKHNNEVHLITENVLPFHPNCRCTTLALIEDNDNNKLEKR